MNTKKEHYFSKEAFENYEDQIGAFLGGLTEAFEGKFNSLTFTGRQKIAKRWRPELVEIGNKFLRGKPDDIRFILESPMMALIEGEEYTKFMRFAIESAKFDKYLGSKYTKKNLETLSNYKTALALEQDASSSGAQIIAMVTRNKRLAELSNVVPTSEKARLYDVVASLTYNDPRFKKINERLGLTEVQLRKASKAKSMVTFYGAGDKTGVLNVEGKLAKILGKEDGVLVVKASDRDTVLNEISARIAKVEQFDAEGASELRTLRLNVRDLFNKGLSPGQDLMDDLHFLDPSTKDLINKMSLSYSKVVTPDDFKVIASIMSDHMMTEVPVLKDFTNFYGRLAEDFLKHAKPKNSDWAWETMLKTKLVGDDKGRFVLPKKVSELLGVKDEILSEKLLRRLSFWRPDSNLAQLLTGVKPSQTRATGKTFFKMGVVLPKGFKWDDLKKGKLLKKKKIELSIGKSSNLPKRWTNIPFVNFDGHVLEQNYTQSFEERILYKRPDGSFATNIVQIDQKSEMDWTDILMNKSGEINDIADLTKARTAYGVNGNHSNDAVLVKKYHLAMKKEGIASSTIIRLL